MTASKSILIIQGHPDSNTTHLGHQLAQAYSHGADTAGHRVQQINIARLQIPLLHSKQEWEHGQLSDELQAAQQAIKEAGHVVLLYPLWLGTMPAILKAFLEQVLRPGFAISFDNRGRWQKQLKGKSARLIITMGMPSLIYRWFYRAHSLKSLERNILRFVGINPVHSTLIGMVDNLSDRRYQKLLDQMQRMGSDAK